MSTINANIESLKKIVSVLPNKPGVYQYYDIEGKLLYVGKAKDLKKRVASYFNKNQDSAKTRILVRKIYEIKHIIVDTEQDALLLENNLIKKYQPRYNVQLKDDKTFPWICVKNERFPRVFSTRNLYKDGSQYFGPYTSGLMVKVLLDLVKQLYKLRNCNLNLSQKNIDEGKFKPCLEFQIGNCNAPCVGKETEEEYNNSIEHIKKILKGNISEVGIFLKKLMKEFSDAYNFEKANEMKEKITILEKFQSKSTIVNPSINNVDVYSIIEDEKAGYVNFLKLVNGAIIQSHTIELKKRMNETIDELLGFAIFDIRHRLNSNSKEIIVPFQPNMNLDEVKFIVPQRGDKKKLLELSERNVKYYRFEKLKNQEKANPMQRVNRVLEKIKTDLRLQDLPTHIEGFDNSNIQGTYAVAACVVFKNGKPSKRDYRKFNVKTVEGPDDFASMVEIVTRRYKRMLNEKQPLPQLIVIDGGKGQLSAAVKALKDLNIYGKIAIIGIAKKLEEIYYPGDSVPLYLDKNSESLKVIQHIRNEAHRFGITFHRDKRSKDFIKTELEEINGIGEKTIDLLLKEFKTVSKIKSLAVEELSPIIGNSKAIIVFSYFQKK
jgi:excinuclease ABC subunit C